MTGKRPSAARHGYGETWRRYRRWFLTLQPVCAHCGRAANEVDHITPLSEGGTHLDPGNSQPGRAFSFACSTGAFEAPWGRGYPISEPCKRRTGAGP